MNRNIQKLLEKLWKGQCTEEELRYLELYFNQAELLEDTLKKSWEAFPDENLDNKSKQSIFNRIEAQLEDKPATYDSSFKKSGGWISKYAAIFTGVVLLGFLISQFLPANQSEPQITIRLNDGSIKEVDKMNSIEIGKGKKIQFIEGERLVYRSNPGNTTKLEYNTVTVPHGKKLEVELADGTLVYLNSGTTFKYPVNFLPGSSREVFITGEAYFEVSHDDKHDFIVNSNNVRTQVLGTKFNVRSFAEDTVSKITLLEGSVKLSSGKVSSMLIPDEVGIVSRVEGGIIVEKVRGDNSIAWLDGYLLFENETFQKIIPELERKYNIVIENRNEKLARKRFRGKFKTEDIEDILKTFSSASPFEFRKKNNEIIIYTNN